MTRKQPTDRRQFLKTTGVLAAGAALNWSAVPQAWATSPNLADPWFKISLAQWSLNDGFFGRTDKKLDPLDFAKIASEEAGIHAIEYVNQFFMDKAKDEKYLGELKKRAKDHGVKSLLIMVDREGKLGDPDSKKRTAAIENHYKWIEAAKFLGCHSIRVNAASEGAYDEQIELAADGLSRLSEFAEPFGLNVIVENHGGLSSNGQWLATVMKKVGRENCGTLPDFGNFLVAEGDEYDRYKGVAELMPYAKAVSAKAHSFDEQGNDTQTDFLKIMKIVGDAGYRGYVGIEYEGKDVTEIEGILLTKALLEKVRDELADQFS